MKFFSILFATCMCIVNSIVYAQEMKYESLMGTWDYKSPKGKDKLTYKFDVDKKFSSIIQHNETELKAEGTYEFDKKGDLDRLKLTLIDNGNTTRTQIIYYLIKPIGLDTIKLQKVSDTQKTWLTETRRNTMAFIRKKEKPKE